MKGIGCASKDSDTLCLWARSLSSSKPFVGRLTADFGDGDEEPQPSRLMFERDVRVVVFEDVFSAVAQQATHFDTPRLPLVKNYEAILVFESVITTVVVVTSARVAQRFFVL